MPLGKLSLRSRIRLVSILVLLATAGLVARIRASVMGPAASAVLGEAVFDTSYFVTASSCLSSSTCPAYDAITLFSPMIWVW